MKIRYVIQYLAPSGCWIDLQDYRNDERELANEALGRLTKRMSTLLRMIRRTEEVVGVGEVTPTTLE